MRIFPVPRYTFTRPSLLIMEPTRDLEDRSTVKSRLVLQQIAYLPSIFIVSFSSVTSIASSAGILLSNATMPFPDRERLKSPSPPATAEERVVRAAIFCLTVPSQAKNMPSSIVVPLAPHEATSSRIKKDFYNKQNLSEIHFSRTRLPVMCSMFSSMQATLAPLSFSSF